MASGFFWGGAFTRRPTVRAVLDDAGLLPISAGAPLTVALIGVGQGGAPGEPILLSSATEAAQIIRGGELLTAAQRCFNPSAESNGASLVYAVRVNPATRAVLTLLDDAAANAIDLSAVGVGSLDNQIQVKVETGTAANSKKITLKDARTSALYVKDSLYGAALSLLYTNAAAASATITISGTQLATTVVPISTTTDAGLSGGETSVSVVSTANFPSAGRAHIAGTDTFTYTGKTGTTFTGVPATGADAVGAHLTGAVVTSDAAADNLTLLFATYPTVGALVAYLATRPRYTAALLAPDKPNAPTANGLDFATAQSIVSVAYAVTRTLQVIVDWFNASQQDLVTAVRATGAGKVPANLAYTYLAGGTEGTAITDDWQAAFDALQLLEVAFIVPVTADDAIHAMGDTHCQYVSSDGRHPRRQFVGADLGENDTDHSAYIVRAADLNSDRTVMVAHGVGGFDAAGEPTTFPPYITAAQLAGLQSGVVEIGTPITNKSVKATGLEWVPTLGDLELLIQGGICALELDPRRGGCRVTRGITTWLKDDNFHRVEISVGIALDEVVRRVISSLDPFLGGKASPIILHRVASRTQSTLMTLKRDAIIVGDSSSPAFKNIQVSLTGDTIIVEFTCSPVLPVNFIGVKIHAEAYTGSITLAVA
jgi:hypothetical protein